ncbi:MAG: FtsW/RodA/SpoVE family cell cycle protein, partial [Fidelibacterota bacterium]
MAVKVSSQKYDRSLLIIVLVLVAFGTVMVFSSSTGISMERFGNGTFYLKRHLLRLMIGLVAMFGAMFIDYRLLKKLAAPLLIGSILLLIITKIQYVGEGNHGSARWLHLGGFNLQTSDVARFAIIVYLASYLDRKRDQVRDLVYGFFPPVVMTGIVMALIIIQPDFSTAVMIGLMAAVLLFAAGAKVS